MNGEELINWIKVNHAENMEFLTSNFDCIYGDNCRPIEEKDLSISFDKNKVYI